MVSRVSLAKEPSDPAGIETRAARAAELRDLAVTLAERDMEAYRAVLATARTRGEHGHAAALSEALSAAADPPAAILEAAAEVTRLAAGAFAAARGAVRGEAVTAAILAEACVRACLRIIALNLGRRADDPRLQRARELAAAAAEDLASMER
jgi:formiminotetrahydrofolate cyclodeaminase